MIRVSKPEKAIDFSYLKNIQTGCLSYSTLSSKGHRGSFSGLEGHHSKPYNIEVKNQWSSTSTAPKH
jgi:hypothetical protein